MTTSTHTANRKASVKPKRKASANRQESGKHPGKKTKTSWKPGQSGNPKGRPAEGQSWSGIFREVTDLTPAEILTLIKPSTPFGQKFKELPSGVQIKYLAALSAVATLIEDPQASLLNAVMDRSDGKVVDKVEMTNEIDISNVMAVIHKNYGPGSDFARTHKAIRDDQQEVETARRKG